MPHSKRILVPVDEKEHCERAFDWYLENYGLEKQEVILLHVYQSLDHVKQTSLNESEEAFDMQKDEMENIFRAAKEQAKVMLEKFEAKCNKLKIPYKTVIELGGPGGAICKIAKEEQVTCIVLGNRGLGAFRRTMLGSFDAIIELTMLSSGPRSIVIAVDGSVHSKRAFKWYAQRLRKEEDQVVFIHVYESPISPPPTFANCATIPPREEWERMHRKAEQRAMDMLANYEAECTHIGLPFKTIYAYGAIGPAICTAAKEEKADCVILGPRGLGTIRRTILGSVCDYVTQHSNIPVLMVPN